jgi:hypothetical protein
MEQSRLLTLPGDPSMRRGVKEDVQETMRKAVELLVSVKGNLKPVNTAGREQGNNQPQRGASMPPEAWLSNTMSELSVCSTVSTKLSINYIAMLAKTQANIASLFSKLRKGCAFWTDPEIKHRSKDWPVFAGRYSPTLPESENG